ncbi:MAG: HAMP domain-containing histidine kinase [Acidobacteria bacterium]|nr:HAMP domain-containing histidine kinase [Acidobacteriota bacterium]
MFIKNILDRLRMRTRLLVPLLFIFFGWTLLSFLILRVIVEQQTRSDLSSDLAHSITTYQNLQHYHREMMHRESVLMADLPTIKALMTSEDKKTIEDAGTEFWRTSDSDLFALFTPDFKLAAGYRRDSVLHASEFENSIQPHLRAAEDSFYLVLDGSLYEVAAQPIIFGDHVTGSTLGYIAVGYALDKRVAQQVSQAAAAEVAFADRGNLLVATLSPDLQGQLRAVLPQIQNDAQGKTVRLGGQRYLAAAIPLQTHGIGAPRPLLVVLKSFEQGQALIMRVNRWVTALGLLVLCAGAAILLSISQSITRPLASLMEGVRAVGGGNYTYRIRDEGAEEVRELSRAFDRMRTQLQQSQKELVQAERLATIGRMASSISHDLRHYLSAIYANAEFMSEANIPQAEREELLAEVSTAVHGMTDLLDSLLLFSQTGRALHRHFESIALILQRAVAMLRSHPAARDVQISLLGLSPLTAYVDAKKLGRAVYNLLLNGCEAAKQSSQAPAVSLTLVEDPNSIRICISDNGAGVAETVKRTMFMPFVSEGKQSGTGLGLTLSEHIASEHGGHIEFERTSDNLTVFSMVLPKVTEQASTDAVIGTSAPTETTS